MSFWLRSALFQVAMLLAASFAAQPSAMASPRGELPIPAAMLALMTAKDTTPAAPVLLRSFKEESEIEVWKQASDGRFVLLKTFPICRWSGALGPKTRQGDRQTPEGFYSIGPKQMNPNSAYYLSFDTGYPNAYDRAHGYTGSSVMVHGICSSAGCFAMTNKEIGEIFAIAREALRGGQAAFQLQAFPFRMTAKNMAKYRSDSNIGFWRELKEGSDRFEATAEELAVSVAAGRYVFAPSTDPAKEALAAAYHQKEEQRIAAYVAEGSAAVRTTYMDGGQNAIFTALMRKGDKLGEISRPEALAFAGVDEIITPARGRCARPEGCPDALAEHIPFPPPRPADEPNSTEDEPHIVLAVAKISAMPQTDPEILAQTPFCYKLGRPTSVQSIITGAMPMLPAVLSD